jgi:hypothetical protein
LLRPNVPKDLPKELYITSLRRDYDFYSTLLAQAGF